MNGVKNRLMTNEVSVTFRELFEELPVQTGLFSFGPVLLGIAQLWNGYSHQTALSFHALFAVVMVGFAVLVTRYHLASFRLEKLERV
ncbi:hypothetical protein ZOD2009_06364 [Haladaptatus paucihalophilus DX253]|uniref:Uncharacterized protein n=2 Tax=Haladaptataceae TaxID=3064797 RepID=E7QR50_HALPU|nr:hypothetical protein ZOD2009_06364 [Haladaptatus paucihalophilus DX253]SHL18218.1 hypothetical protein SAMN05444342_3163 [Haladaptatus paucihalophilus DX253]